MAILNAILRIGNIIVQRYQLFNLILLDYFKLFLNIKSPVAKKYLNLNLNLFISFYNVLKSYPSLFNSVKCVCLHFRSLICVHINNLKENFNLKIVFLKTFKTILNGNYFCVGILLISI